jgi:hypothetical protein
MNRSIRAVLEAARLYSYVRRVMTPEMRGTRPIHPFVLDERAVGLCLAMGVSLGLVADHLLLFQADTKSSRCSPKLTDSPRSSCPDQNQI